MADLQMPDGLSESDQRRWLQRLGRRLAEETGQPEGVAEQQPGPDGQPIWAVWWTEESFSREATRPPV